MSSAGWRDIKYRQDMPPPGGYGAVPYKRNIPIRGPSGFIILGFGIAIHALMYFNHHYKRLLNDERLDENKQAEMAMKPLLDAEKDRAELRDWKEHIESEALNIVGTGFDPTYLPGEPEDVMHTKRWEVPFMGSDSALSFRIRSWYFNHGVPRCGP